MSTLKNKLQHLIEGQIPDYLRESYPKFASFLKEYYTFLDKNRQVNGVLLNSSKWTDVDLTLDLFVEEMRKQYAYDISPEALVEQRRLIKFINQYYESKGTENAAELFFRMMYNDTVTIKYPGDYVLRASDGIWESKKTIKIDTDYTQIDPSSLALAPATLRTEPSDVFSLKEKTIYLKYHRREETGLNLYSLEFGCVNTSRIITNQDIYKLEIDIPKATRIDDVNTALSTLPYYDTVWVTAFDNGVEYVYGFLTQQLIGYEVLYGGENFRRRDTFTVEVSESALYPIPGQENNNGIVRVAGTTSKDAEEYFATDYVIPGSEYAISDAFSGIINSLRFISTGHRFDITGDYFAEAYDESNDYTTYKDFDRVFDNPRGNEYATLVTGDYFQEYSGDSRYMETNDDTGYTDFNVDTYNITAARIRFQVGYIYEHSGAWKNNAGFLSDINKLQDNYYYQPYSYVVQTRNTPYETWNTLYNNSAHPAGFIAFGELLIEDSINLEPITIESTQYYIQTFIDGVQPVDGVAKDVEKPIEDAVVYTDDETYEFNKVLDVITVEPIDSIALDVEPVFADSILTNEQTIKEVTLFGVTDSIIFSDSAESEITIVRTFEDTFTANDDGTYSPDFFAEDYAADIAFEITVDKVLDTPVIANDTLAFEIENVLIDTFNSTDNITKDVSLLNVTDSIETNESLDKAFEYGVNLTDSFILNDVLIKDISFSLSDNSELNDETAISFEKNNITDSFTLSDSSTKNIDLVIDVVNTYSSGTYFDEDYVNENQVTFIEEVIVSTVVLDDTVVTSDESAKWLYRTTEDYIAADDNLTTKESTLNKSETVNTVDTITQIDTEIHFADSITVTDTAIRTFDQQNDATSDLAEDLSIGDESTISIEPNYIDTITLSDDPVVLDVDFTLFDTPIITETLAKDPHVFFDNSTSATDLICIGIDDYVAAEYVDIGYAGTVACTFGDPNITTTTTTAAPTTTTSTTTTTAAPTTTTSTTTTSTTSTTTTSTTTTTAAPTTTTSTTTTSTTSTTTTAAPPAAAEPTLEIWYDFSDAATLTLS